VWAGGEVMETMAHIVDAHIVPVADSESLDHPELTFFIAYMCSYCVSLTQLALSIRHRDQHYSNGSRTLESF
jgi:hypothetical protein